MQRFKLTNWSNRTYQARESNSLDGLHFDVTHDDAGVVVHFEVPVTLFTMSPTLAREVARVLVRNADLIVERSSDV
jgi:hypothetical protein